MDKGNKPVTYEEAHAPHYIAHRKGWLSLHTGNLDGEDHVAERTVEDVFLRKFMLGTFPGCLAEQLILKRQANQVEICALVLRQLPAHKFYFLVGYSETLLSHFYTQGDGRNLPSLLRGTGTVPSPHAPPTPSPVPHSRRGCTPESPVESGLASRGSQGLRSPLESRRGSLAKTDFTEKASGSSIP